MFVNLKELKDKIRIEDIVSNFIKLKKAGSSYEASCPFHNDKSPSFKINKKDNSFKCFGCGASGDAISFVLKHQGVSFIESVEIIAKMSNFQLEYDNKPIEKPLPRLQKVSDSLLSYFEKERHISNNTLLRFKVTESMESFRSLEDGNKFVQKKAICFNYYKNGELVNIKFRAREKKYMKLQPNAELVFYNIDSIKDTSECVICEGEICNLSLYEAGIHNAISVPNGAGSKNFKYIDNCYDFFVDKKKIIIAVDNDEAGRGLKEELINRFGRVKCFVVEFPSDCKDNNDVLVKYGKEKLRECIENAQQLNILGVVNKKDRKQAIDDLYDNGVPQGTPAGIMGLDDYIRFQGGLVTVISGSPSSGKSEFLDYISANLAVRSNWRFSVFSFENQPIVLHDQKIIEKIAGKAFAFRKDINYRVSKKEKDLIFEIVNNNFYTIDKTQCDTSVDGILLKTEELILRYGVKGVIIDPYNKINHKTSNMYDPSYVNEFMNKITNFAVSWNVHIFLVAHPSKLLKDKNTGQVEKPNLYSISGGANFYNQMDNGIIIHRDRATGLVDVNIGKIRFNEQGKEGFVSFTYNTLTRQYSYASSSEQPIKNNYKPLKEIFIDSITENYEQTELNLEFPPTNGLTEEQLSAFD